MILTGKTPKGTAIKGADKKGQEGPSNGQGPSGRRVKFDLSANDEEMETEAEADREVVNDEGPEMQSVARAPSFFIGKPLKDYDASNGRVSQTLIRNDLLIVQLLGKVLKGNC